MRPRRVVTRTCSATRWSGWSAPDTVGEGGPVRGGGEVSSPSGSPRTQARSEASPVLDVTQQPPDPVERVVFMAAPAQGVLLDAASDFIGGQAEARESGRRPAPAPR